MELLILIIAISLVLIYLWKTEPNAEPFTVTLTACPTGYTLFDFPSGDNGCCDGRVVNKKCIGKSCSLGGTIEKDCAIIILEEYANKAKEQCPISMPSYFELKGDKGEIKEKGCTKGELNNTLSGP